MDFALQTFAIHRGVGWRRWMCNISATWIAAFLVVFLVAAGEAITLTGATFHGAARIDGATASTNVLVEPPEVQLVHPIHPRPHLTFPLRSSLML